MIKFNDSLMYYSRHLRVANARYLFGAQDVHLTVSLTTRNFAINDNSHLDVPSFFTNFGITSPRVNIAAWL